MRFRKGKLALAILTLPFFIVGAVIAVVGLIVAYPFVKVVGMRYILNWRGV